MIMSWFLKFFKDMLFPIYCVECNKEGEWWCDDCLDKNNFQPITDCSVCHKSTGISKICNTCRLTTCLDGLFSFLPYGDKSSFVDILIKEFKYNSLFDIKVVWQKIIAAQTTKLISFLESDCRSDSFSIIPVPLYSARERKRGFNQSAIISDIIFLELQKKLLNNKLIFNKSSLLRIRQTLQQAKLTHQDRIKNIEGAFIWRGNLCTKNVILIDDIFTSGVTVEECVKILKKNGADNVFCVTLARTKIKN